MKFTFSCSQKYLVSMNEMGCFEVMEMNEKFTNAIKSDFIYTGLVQFIKIATGNIWDFERILKMYTI